MDAEGLLGSLSFPAVQSGEESSTGLCALHSEATVTHTSSLQGRETTSLPFLCLLPTSSRQSQPAG